MNIQANTSLAEKVAVEREGRADFCERAAGHHKGSVWALNYADEGRQWREAADRARAGDLSPFRPN